MPDTDLSIIIPAHNEADKISRDITEAADFLKGANLSGDIIIVDDASTDGTASAAQQTQVPQGITLKVTTLEQNRGKGFAVKTGMLQSTGRFAMFADSGCCIAFSEALTGTQLIEQGRCHIAIGSRKLATSQIIRGQSLKRRICSWLFFHVVVRRTKKLRHMSDTQCGFKVFDGDIARELFEASMIEGFLFDIEILLLAFKRGYGVEEFPIKWTCDLDSRLSPHRDLYPILCDLQRLRKLTRP
jgi:dolichyl-phosphate beta-glucosyltransferase